MIELEKRNKRKGKLMRDNVIIFDHPLIQHKISLIHSKDCGTREFRTVAGEISMLMGYEVMRDLETELVEIETPLEKMKGPMLKGKKLAIVPILRAGLGMVDGMLSLVPSAKVGHVGMYRDEETLEPKEYYCKLPEDISQRLVIIVDPMLATGGSADAAVDFVKKQGASRLSLCRSLRLRKVWNAWHRHIRISAFTAAR